MFHRCRYKTFGSACNRNGITEVDVICPKCNNFTHTKQPYKNVGLFYVYK